MTHFNPELTVETHGDTQSKVYTSDEAYTVCGSALNHFGSKSQRMKAVEEFTELALALCRYIQEPTDMHFDLVIDEIADANVMLMQMAILFGHQDVVNHYFTKLERLEKMIKE